MIPHAIEKIWNPAVFYTRITSPKAIHYQFAQDFLWWIRNIGKSESSTPILKRCTYLGCELTIASIPKKKSVFVTAETTIQIVGCCRGDAKSIKLDPINAHMAVKLQTYADGVDLSR